MYLKLNMLRSNKTKKVSNKKNTKHLWNLFDEEVSNKDESKKIECIYSKDDKGDIIHNDKSGRDTCDLCKSAIMITDQGFYACSNDKCGIIFRDKLDETAEWRYYGASDNNSSDPTRCGMPINPLLKEPSYGCKVICGVKSSYEIEK